MVLRDWHITGGAVYLTGGSVHNPLHTEFARCLQYVECALDIGVDIHVGRVIWVWNGNQGSEMHHDLAALHGRSNSVRDSNVPGEHVEVRPNMVVRRVAPSPGT